METHSSILAWEIPWTEEPGELQSMGSKRVGQDWVIEHTHALVEQESIKDALVPNWGTILKASETLNSQWKSRLQSLKHFVLRFLSSVIFKNVTGKSEKGVRVDTAVGGFCIRFNLDSTPGEGGILMVPGLQGQGHALAPQTSPQQASHAPSGEPVICCSIWLPTHHAEVPESRVLLAYPGTPWPSAMSGT